MGLLEFYFATCRLILIAEKDTVYDKFPTPLINRLEKHFVLTSSILEQWQEIVLKHFEKWIKKFAITRYSACTNKVCTSRLSCCFFCLIFFHFPLPYKKASFVKELGITWQAADWLYCHLFNIFANKSATWQVNCTLSYRLYVLYYFLEKGRV